MPRLSLDDIKRSLTELSMGELETLAGYVRADIARRVEGDSPDPELLIRKAMQTMFSVTDVDAPEQVSAGLLAVPGQVASTGHDGRLHKCQLFTIMADGEGSAEMWAWDESLETLVDSETSKVGNVRRSVSLHAAMKDMVLVRHRMAFDGKRHTRTSATAWRVRDVDDEGDISLETLFGWHPTALPPPHVGAVPSGRIAQVR